MKNEHIVRVFAGSVVLLGSILAYYHSHLWVIFTGVVGLHLVQSAFTGFCPLEMILKRVRS